MNLKCLVYGVILAILEGIAGYIFNIPYLTIFGTLSIVFIVLAVLISGLAVSGDRQRANFHSETKQERRFKIQGTLNILIMALPTVIIFIILLMIK
ncbi:DUF5316 family protein [Bacillus mexicanus]|uniref:DUF5316 family protein n=1 Tax=Bacillus mexicanus TaxID=2834415 RepID=UPI003D1A84B8